MTTFQGESLSLRFTIESWVLATVFFSVLFTVFARKFLRYLTYSTYLFLVLKILHYLSSIIQELFEYGRYKDLEIVIDRISFWKIDKVVNFFRNFTYLLLFR